MPFRVLVVDDSATIRAIVRGILERKGFEVTVASDGLYALQQLRAKPQARMGVAAESPTSDGGAAPFDLVLIDFVMPRMNGFQLCRAMQQEPSLKTIPVVLMSAKSDKIREHFVRQTGAIDAITKPFDADALVLVIENALRRVEEWRSRVAAGGVPPSDPFEPTQSSTRSVEVRRVNEALELVRRIAAVAAPVLARLPPGALGNEAKLATELATGIGPEALGEIADALRALDGGGGTRVALSGDIASVAVGAVLQLLQMESQTGLLVISNRDRDVTIAMRNGLIDLVQARGAGREFRLGRYFVELGVMSADEIDTILREAAENPGRGVPRAPISRERLPEGELAKSSSVATPRPAAPRPGRAAPTLPSGSPVFSAKAVVPDGLPALGLTESGTNVVFNPEAPAAAPRLIGDLLVGSGRVTREQLLEALERQSSELIYDVLRWQKGRFEFKRETLPSLADSARLALPVASVVMEGFRRVDEWNVIEGKIGNFDTIILRDPMAISALGNGGLSKQEQLVLDLVDGKRTVRDIIAGSHMSSFDVCKVLFQLLEARLVRRRAA